MKKLLRDNPVGPLPNTRRRYLTKDQEEAYLRSAIEDGIRSGDDPNFSFARLRADLTKGRTGTPRAKGQKGLGQVGIVDRANPRFAKRRSFEQ